MPEDLHMRVTAFPSGVVMIEHHIVAIPPTDDLALLSRVAQIIQRGEVHGTRDDLDARGVDVPASFVTRGANKNMIDEESGDVMSLFDGE